MVPWLKVEGQEDITRQRGGIIQAAGTDKSTWHKDLPLHSAWKGSGARNGLQHPAEDESWVEARSSRVSGVRVLIWGKTSPVESCPAGTGHNSSDTNKKAKRRPVPGPHGPACTAQDTLWWPHKVGPGPHRVLSSECFGQTCGVRV